MALAYHCDECGRNWPRTSPYVLCPECQVPTRTTVTATVMSPGEARETLRNIEFVRFCAKRDQEREERGDPAPEDIGRQEATELARAWREAVEAIGELRA